MLTHNELVKRAKNAITDNFGVLLSVEYEKFYEDKDNKMIISSLVNYLAQNLLRCN